MTDEESVNPEDLWPRTIDEAVHACLLLLSDKEKGYIKQLPQDDLIELHMSLGMAIRNNFGLWGGNDDLMDACDAWQPDDASGVIIEALWNTLQA